MTGLMPLVLTSSTPRGQIHCWAAPVVLGFNNQDCWAVLVVLGFNSQDLVEFKTSLQVSKLKTLFNLTLLPFAKPL